MRGVFWEDFFRRFRRNFFERNFLGGFFWEEFWEILSESTRKEGIILDP